MPLQLVGTDLSSQPCYKPVVTDLLQIDDYNGLLTSCSDNLATTCC